jgi:twitching motility protein PilT
MANQIDPLFEHMISQGGSDLHLSEGEPPKFRRHGAIQPIREERLSGEEIRSLMEEICRETMWEKFIESGDLDFAYEMNAESRFRCNYHRHSNGIGAIFRLIPTKIPTIEQLGLPMVIEREFGNMRSGLVLVTGPTGSGKSTTLAALINYINRTYTRHIITIEEPIEFVHENLKSIITQREVPSETPSFSVGLKASLREDADVVLVGEMRDLETISLALTAAETGLLVFGTLHTNSAAKTIDRVIDAFPAEQQELVRTMLSTSLRGVVAQLLMQKKDGSGRGGGE